MFVKAPQTPIFPQSKSISSNGSKFRDRRAATRHRDRLLSPKLDKFFSLSHDLLCVLDLDGHFVQLSPTWETLLGCSRDRLRQHPWIERVYPEDLSATLSKINELVVCNLESATFKNRYQCENGVYKWLLWKASYWAEERAICATVHDLGERPVCTLASDRSKPEPHFLHSSEEHFRLLVDSIQDYAIYTLDKNGRVVSWNAGAEKVSGWQAHEILGRHTSEFFPSEEVDRGAPEQVLGFAAAQGRVEFENWRVRQDGSHFWANVVVNAMKDDRGQLLGYTCITRDMTRRKQEEEALQQAYDELETRVADRTAELTKANAQLRHEIRRRQGIESALRTSRERLKNKAVELERTLSELQQTQAQLIQTEKMSSLGQLVAGIAHEINNPINFIHGNIDHAGYYTGDLLCALDLYRRHYPDPVDEIQEVIEDIDLDFVMEDMPKLLSSMRLGTDRVREIVRSLRNFSHHDRAHIKEVDLHEGIDSTLLILQHQFKATETRSAVKLVKDYGDLPLIECHPCQLNQVFMNIISNAVAAFDECSPSPEFIPEIVIRTQRESDAVTVTIADNGPGMPESVRSRIFDPFYTTKPVGKGTGLGLSISYQIVVDRHGGKLECRSTPGQGTEFIIEIPQGKGVA